MQGEELLKQIEAVPLTDIFAFEQVSSLGRIAKRLGQHVETLFEGAVKATDKAHRDVLSLRNMATSKFEACEDLSKARLSEAYQAHTDWKADGVTITEPWGFEVLDQKLLPNTYLTPDQKKLRGIVTALGMEAEKSIPGIRVFPKIQVAFRVGDE